VEIPWAKVLAHQFIGQDIKIEKIIDKNHKQRGKVLQGNVQAEPDLVFIIDGEQYPVELKTAYSYNFFSIKVHSLESAIKREARIILVNESRWVQILSDGMKFLLDNFPHEIYEKFSPKPAIRVHMNQERTLAKDKIIHIKKWNKNAKAKIEEFRHYLFKK